jgi:hypothetical protein
MEPPLIILLVIALLALIARPQRGADPIVITIAREGEPAAPGGCIAPLLAVIALLLLVLVLGV